MMQIMERRIEVDEEILLLANQNIPNFGELCAGEQINGPPLTEKPKQKEGQKTSAKTMTSKLQSKPNETKGR